MNLNEAKGKVAEFCAKELGKDTKAVRFLKLNKVGEGWATRVEITEQDEYLKKLGYPPIFDRNIYNVELDGKGNVTGFCKKGEEEEEF
ncbi:MAG: hypothetical protein ABIE74_01060 [Pseudomonadota bacterium]